MQQESGPSEVTGDTGVGGGAQNVNGPPCVPIAGFEWLHSPAAATVTFMQVWTAKVTGREF